MMIKRMVIMLIAIGAILGGIFGFQAYKNRMVAKYLAEHKAPAQIVSTTETSMSDWQHSLSSVGSFNAVEGSNLSAQVPGIVEKIAFKDGADITKGTLLVQLLADQQIAQLEQLKANERLAQLNYERSSRLVKTQAVSKATADTDLSNLQSAQAQIAAQQALIDQYSIRAPFDGRLGLRQVDLGQYLAAGTPVVTLQSLDPIQFDFTLPQQALSQISVGQTVTTTVDTYGDKTFTGKITAISPLINTESRSLAIRASFPNPDRQLLPGMFAKVSIPVGTPESFITLPQTAVTVNPYGNLVYVVSDEGKGADGKPQLVATQTFVTTGEARGDQIAIVKGLTVGQTVVTTGQVKLSNGSPVAINNTVQPPDQANASPPNPN